MSPRQRWFAGVAVLWGVPAFMLWLLLGAWLVVDEERTNSQQYLDLRRTLDRIVMGRYDLLLLDPLLQADTRALAEACRTATQPATAAAWTAFVRQREAAYPDGCAHLFLFDRAGRLLTDRGPYRQAALERTFARITRPWASDTARPDPRELDLCDEVVAQPGHTLIQIRGHADVTVRLYHHGPGRATHLFYHAVAAPGPVGTLLAVIDFSRVNGPPLMLRMPRLLGRPDIHLFAAGTDGNIMETGELPAGLAAACARALRDQCTGQVRCGDWLALSTSLHITSFIAVGRAWQMPILFIAIIFTLYAILSHVIIFALRRVTVDGEVIHCSLRLKLVGLLGLGIAFPLLLTGILAHFVIQGRYAALLAENRADGLRALDDLDARFEGHLRAWELRLRTMRGAHGPPPSLPELRRRLDAEYAAMAIDEYFVISSAAKIIAWRGYDAPLPLLRSALGPRAERIALLHKFTARGMTLSPGDVAVMTDPRPFAERLPSFDRNDPTAQVNKLLSSISRDAMAAHNTRHGFAAPPVSATDLAVSGLFSDEVGDLAKISQATLGTLQAVNGPLGDAFIYLDVVAGPDGAAAGTVFVNIRHATFFDAYLASACSDLGGSATRLIALPPNWARARSFPTADDALTWGVIAERLTLQPGATINERVVFAGTDYEVVARQGNLLPKYTLLQITPVSVIMAKLQYTIHRVYLLVAAALVFCLLLVRVTLDRLLPPVSDLSAGIAAMGAKAFALRLPTDRADELGRLFAAFNRAMEALADMQLAAAVQARILPKGDLTAQHLRVTACNQMTQATGGDFLDHFTLGDGRVVFALGDVTGHGISAALVTAMAKAAVRLLCPRMPDTPNEVLRRIAQLFFEVLERRLAMTCILGVADPASGQIILANAGQTFPLLLRAGTSPSFVEAPTTFPLGLSKKAAIAQVHLDLVGATVTATQPAAVDIGRGHLSAGRVALVLYTDGLIEAIDESGQQIGFERFKAIVQRTIGEGAQSGTAVFAALRAITGRVPWPDDASLLVVEWLAAGRADAPPSSRNDVNPVTAPARSRPTAPCP